MKVLIVDDDASTRFLLRRILVRDLACEVSEADNGVAALDALAKESFTFVLLDVEMPVMGGIQTLQAIRASAEHANLPVIMLTAAKEESAVRTIMGLGISCYMIKPLKPEQISARLAKLASSITGEVKGGTIQPSTLLQKPALRVNLALAAQQVLGNLLGADVTVASAGAEAEVGRGMFVTMRVIGTDDGVDLQWEMCCTIDTARRLAAGLEGRTPDTVREADVPAALVKIANTIGRRLQVAMAQRGVTFSCSSPASRAGDLSVPGRGDRLVIYLQSSDIRIRVMLVAASQASAAPPTGAIASEPPAA